MSRYQVRLFGYPNVWVSQRLVRFERRKSLGLFAYVCGELVNDGVRGRARESVAAIFWPKSTQDQAGAYLRHALWEIKRAAGGDLILTEDQIITIHPDVWVDVVSFEDRLRGWKMSRTDSEAASGLLQAVELYRDDFLASFNLPDTPDFDHWQSLQRETLRLHFAQALEALSRIFARAGDWVAASGYTRRWLELDQTNEAAHRALIQIYLRSNQPAAAARQYEACRMVLKAELGIEPEAETQALLRENAGRKAERPGSRLPAKAAVHRGEPSRQPTGIVTFLFTDIEGSTRLWQRHPGAMPAAFARQESIIREAVAAHGGYLYKMIGDAFQAAFSLATDALGAAVDAQRALSSEPWGETGMIKVRMAIHTGVTEERQDDYVGPTLNRVARIMSAGHGGQILLNRPTYELVHNCLLAGVTLLDLGECFLKDLEEPEHIYQIVATGLPGAFPPLRTVYEPLARLPIPPTPFIGREYELARIDEVFGNPQNRLLTLVGMGGIGKTRLAIEAARLEKERHGKTQQGVGFVDLSRADSLAAIVGAMAKTVNLAFHTLPGLQLSAEAAQQQLFGYLAEKELLLVLDNFEHLIDHTAFVPDLLAAAPRIRLIITSRQRLNLPGESVIEVFGLPFPGRKGFEMAAEYAAVQLFLQGAERAAQFMPSGEDLPAVARICQVVEGLPLGVEMAAAWTKVLTCQEIADEIERDVNFLAFDWRGMPERHRTLRVVFEHSWRLLLDHERSTLLHLTVFQGGFNRMMALEVANAPLTLLGTLMDKSFLRRISAGRFEIHPVLRPFLVEKLEASGARAQLCERHAHRFFDWMIEMSDLLKGRDLITALAAMRSEHLNLLEALSYLTTQRDFIRLKRCLPELILFELMDDQSLYQAQVDRLLYSILDVLPHNSETKGAEETQNINSVLALTLAGLRTSAWRNGQQEKVIPIEQRCLGVIKGLPDTLEKADAMLLNCLGQGCMPQEEKISFITQAKDLFERLGNQWGSALAWMIIGDLMTFENFDPDTARAAYQVSLEGFTALGNLWGRALCLTGLQRIEKQTNHLEFAYQVGLESLDIFTRLNSPARLFYLNAEMAEIAKARGNYEQARQYYAANLRYLTDIGNLPMRARYQELIDALPVV